MVIEGLPVDPFDYTAQARQQHKQPTPQHNRSNGRRRIKPSKKYRLEALRERGR